MPKLPVEGLPSGDAGRLLVRLNYKHRRGVPRYGVAKLSNNANRKSLDVLLLGHDREDAIFMPYDIRVALGVANSGALDFSVEKVGQLGKVRWYLNSPDPAVHVPAWIAVFSLILAVVGFGIAVVPLLSA